MGQREQVAKLEMELEELMARLQEPVPNFHQSGNGFHQGRCADEKHQKEVRHVGTRRYRSKVSHREKEEDDLEMFLVQLEEEERVKEKARCMREDFAKRMRQDCLQGAKAFPNQSSGPSPSAQRADRACGGREMADLHDPGIMLEEAEQRLEEAEQRLTELRKRADEVRKTIMMYKVDPACGTDGIKAVAPTGQPQGARRGTGALWTADRDRERTQRGRRRDTMGDRNRRGERPLSDWNATQQPPAAQSNVQYDCQRERGLERRHATSEPSDLSLSTFAATFSPEPRQLSANPAIATSRNQHTTREYFNLPPPFAPTPPSTFPFKSRQRATSSTGGSQLSMREPGRSFAPPRQVLPSSNLAFPPPPPSTFPSHQPRPSVFSSHQPVPSPTFFVSEHKSRQDQAYWHGNGLPPPIPQQTAPPPLQVYYFRRDHPSVPLPRCQPTPTLAATTQHNAYPSQRSTDAAVDNEINAIMANMLQGFKSS